MPRVTAVNPKAAVMRANGLNGQGAFELSNPAVCDKIKIFKLWKV
ncbi:MAG: hypothetical protein ACLTE2_01760 [Eubacteriales bacterium]